MRKSSSFLLALLLVPTTTLTSCSKGSEDTKSGEESLVKVKTIERNSILSKIPASSIGFLSYDYTSEGAKKYRTSTLSDPGSIERALSQVEDENVKSLVKIMQSLIKAGLISSNPTEAYAFTETVGYLGGGDLLANPDIGVFSSASPGVNLQEKLATLEGIFKSDGFSPQKEQIGQSVAFSIPIELKDSPIKASKIFFAATPDRLAISSSPVSAARLFDGSVQDGGVSLKESPGYKSAVAKVATSASQFGYSYLDLAALITQLGDQLPYATSMLADIAPVPTEGQTPAEGEGTTPPNPEEQKKRLKEISAQIPLDSLFTVGSMDSALSYQFLIGMTPKSDEQKGWFYALSSGGSANVISKMPAGMVFLLSIDGKLINGIKDSMIGMAPPGQGEMIRSSLAPLESLKSLGIGVKNNSGGMPFPDLVIVAETDKAADLQTNVRDLLTFATGASGVTMSPWQSKEIDGVKLNYTLTPLGIGVFIAESNGAVILASTEMAARDVAGTMSGKTKSITSEIGKAAQDSLEKSKAPIVYFVDMDQAATMLKSVQGSLAMFTGGQAGMTDEQLDKMKALGQALGTLSFKDSFLDIQQTYTSKATSVK